VLDLGGHDHHGESTLPYRVRVVYQFVNEVVESRPLDDFLKDLDLVATDSNEREQLCGPRTGSKFCYNTGYIPAQK
jgi:hypothetical protein